MPPKENDEAVKSYVQKFIDEHGALPKYRRIAADLGLSHPTTALRIVRRLVKAGDLNLDGLYSEWPGAQPKPTKDSK